MTMNKPLYVLNGPNLNRLGKREPEIYGTTTLAEIEASCRTAAGEWPLVFHQTNSEERLIDLVHQAIDEGAGILINPAAFTFTSLALLDALKMFPGPIIEFHISNIHRREAIYHAPTSRRRRQRSSAGSAPRGTDSRFLSSSGWSTPAADRKRPQRGAGSAP